tara:strand:+ start:541 stop:1032 length:492 start_codon:yes stop_codon:yes gene_type:complete
MINPNEAPLQVAGIAWRDIQKGDTIPSHKVEEMYSILFRKDDIEPPRTSEDSFATVRVKQWLENARDLINKPLVIKQANGSLVVLTDAEAIDYVGKKADAGLKQQKRYTRRLFKDIDESNLTGYQKDQLHSSQAKQAFIAASIEGARKQALTGNMPKLTPPDK